MPHSKTKKRKRNHQERDLTEAEIWDDSALINNWNAALKEYELYHSIAARGEDVDEVLGRMQECDGGKGVDAPRSSDGDHHENRGREDLSEDAGLSQEDGEIDEVGEEHGGYAVPTTATETRVRMEPDLALPQVPASTTAARDQTLENIKMAYWWAGYYSGLYEGQTQAQAQDLAQSEAEAEARSKDHLGQGRGAG